MNDDQIDDLKQYISTTLSQATSDMATKSDLAILKSDLANLQFHVDSRLDEIQTSIAEILIVANDSVDEQIRTHDIRITALEQLAAR